MQSLRPKQIDFDKVWRVLEPSVAAVINCQNIPRKTWDGAFSDIYDLCVALPEPLADKLYLKTRDCLENHVESLHKEVSESSRGELLLMYHNKWKVYYGGTKSIHSLFGYLNKQHIKRQKYSDADLTYGGITVDTIQNSMLEIGELALDIWRRKMIEPLEKDLLEQLLASLAGDRSGTNSVSQGVIHGVIHSLVEVEEYRTRNQLELYERVFEKSFLEASSEHYKAEAARLLESCDCSKYMEQVIALIDDENRRARRFLHSSSYDKVTRMCEEVMVAAHQDRLHAVSKDLVEKELRQDLQNMYKLLKPVPHGLTVLIREFQAHVKRTGMAGVEQLKGEAIPQQFVSNVLSVHEKFNEIVSSVFYSDQEFLSAMDKALHAVVNFKEESRACPKASEWLAKYTDILLRKSAKGLSEAEVDDKLSKTITIFRYIEDKDIFQKFYSRMLAQRLIHSLSVSMDAEELMINKLKQACGYEFTSKLQRMFTDIGLSKELTDKLNTFLKEENKKMGPIQMNVQVLQAGAWPLSNQQSAVMGNFAVPVELQPSVGLFEEFYNRHYSGRKLNWLFNLATAEVRMGYLDKPYQITMSVQQLAVMSNFAEVDECSVHEIATATQLNPEILGKVLRSLIEGTLLLCEGDLSNESTAIYLNLNYTSKRLRFKVLPSVFQQRQTEKETEQVNTTVQQDRKYFLECTIVRIMKTRKILKHNGLIQEVISQCRSRFTPDISFIKKIIESLIEKQYLQRTENPDEYAYLA